MSGTLDSFFGPMINALTSSDAVFVYGALVGGTVAIGIVIKIAPKLWRFLWHFVGEDETDPELMRAYHIAAAERDLELEELREYGRQRRADAEYKTARESTAPAEALARWRDFGKGVS